MRTHRHLVTVCTLLGLLAVSLAEAQTPREKLDMDVVAKIRDEGMKRSQVMETISYLTDVHGPRLTGSPQIQAAGMWAKARLAEWGLENAQLEPWGPFGRGWSLEGFSANMVAPSFSPLIACPKAWSPSTPKAVRGTPIYLDAATEKDLDQYRGKLHRAIVMISPPREVKAIFDSPARRQTDESLLNLANSDGASRGFRSSATPAAAAPSRQPERDPANPAPAPNAVPSAVPVAPDGYGRSFGGSPEQRAAAALLGRKWQLVYEEGAAVVLEPGRGDGGTIFVQSVTLPSRRTPSAASTENAPGAAAPNTPANPAENRANSPPENPFSRGPRPWAQEAPEIVPQVVLAVEHYNRILRMLKKNVDVQLELDIAARFHTEDLMSFNVIAEIPGTDLKDEVVMLGGHFDSWHSGTGATDNAVGCGVAMEAVRILQAIQVKPRRTIRIALWTGEEQGLLGSREYVTAHFGRQVTPARSPAGPAPAAAAVAAANSSSESAARAANGGNGQTSGPSGPAPAPGPGPSNAERPPSRYELKPAHEKFCGYFNLDNGTGKVRGIYLQNNEALRPIFRTWLTPFADMGATTVSLANTGGTDHLSFDGIGLPGFQFIQDPLEYDTRTHHSSMDVYDRIQEEDVKQASIIMASFVYHAAMRDEKLPRKPLIGEIVTSPDAK